MLTRRRLLAGYGTILAAGIVPLRVHAQARVSAQTVEIHMKSDAAGGVVGFDPIGLLLRPGQTVRWTCDANVHTTTAYSPKNDNHSLRIPEDAKPWASDLLLPGQTFEVRLTAEGVYDYFCAPHEMAGMVGRLIVGNPTGPGSQPFDYFEAEGKHWDPVPPAAQKAFPAIAEIMQRKVVSSPLNFSK
jgi:plastocyanin